MTEENLPSRDRGDEMLIFIFETLKVIIISLAIVLPIRYYLVQPFFVKGRSMEPNFHDKDYILVDKLSYRLGDPSRGDVIVFRPPNDPKEYYIKRIIGLPGETVELADNKVVVYNSKFPNGLTLDEKLYLPNYQRGYSHLKDTLGPGEYFVLGDNRPNSADSRTWGNLPKSNIAGRALIRLLPFRDMLKIPHLKYSLLSPAV